MPHIDIEVVLAAAGLLGLAVGATRLLWPRIKRTTVVVDPLADIPLPPTPVPAEYRFRVIHRDQIGAGANLIAAEPFGARARRIYEQCHPKDCEVYEFWDGTDFRGRRTSKDT